MVHVNETIANQTQEGEDIFLLFAGHLLLVFYCLIFIFGLLGNSAVIFVALQKKKYRNVTNCYIVNLAIADLLFLTVSIPYTTYLGLVNTYPFDGTLCNIYTYLAYVFLLATCNTLAVMSVDRYFYIVLPRGSLRWRTSQNAFFTSLAIWATAIALIIPYHLISHSLAPNSRACGVNNHENFLVCFFVFCSYYAIPLMIIIICYSKLAAHVIRSNQLITSHMIPQIMPKSLKAKQKRVTRMVMVVTLAFAISWLPIHTLELMKCAQSTLLNNLIASYPKALYTIRAVTHALAYFNSCLNPYLYALLNRNFCFDLIDIIPSCFTCIKTKEFLKKGHSNVNTKLASLPDDVRLAKVRPTEDEDDDDDDDDEDDHLLRYDAPKPTDIDASCQVELLRMSTH